MMGWYVQWFTISFHHILFKKSFIICKYFFVTLCSFHFIHFSHFISEQIFFHNQFQAIFYYLTQMHTNAHICSYNIYNYNVFTMSTGWWYLYLSVQVQGGPWCLLSRVWLTSDTVLEIPCFYMQIVKRFMCAICTVCVRYMFAMHSLFTRYMFGLCSFYAVHIRHVRLMFVPRSVYTRQCSADVLCMFGARSFIVRFQHLGDEEAPNWGRIRRTTAEQGAHR